MIKIGDFSKLSRVTVKTLRFYDEIGLLRPVSIDPFTGYRSYSAGQLTRLNRILVFKDLGFSLEQIGGLLDQDVSIQQVREMLRSKAIEIAGRIREDEQRLDRIEALLRQIEQEEHMSTYEVILKRVEPQRVASVRGVTPTFEVIGPTLDRMFDEVFDFVCGKGVRTGPGIALYHDNGESGRDIAIEAATPIYEPLKPGGRVDVYELPGAEQMASVVHHGSFATLHDAYQAIGEWLEANSYTITGPCREIYLEYERGGDQSHYVTEIQFPVSKS